MLVTTAGEVHKLCLSCDVLLTGDALLHTITGKDSAERCMVQSQQPSRRSHQAARFAGVANLVTHAGSQMLFWAR